MRVNFFFHKVYFSVELAASPRHRPADGLRQSREGALISRPTKDALAAAKARGVVIGGMRGKSRECDDAGWAKFSPPAAARPGVAFSTAPNRRARPRLC
jgi:hypothetical protein